MTIHHRLRTLVLVSAAALASCGDSSSGRVDANEEHSANDEHSATQQKTADALDATKTAWTKSKEAASAIAAETLAKIDKAIADLKAKFAASNPEAKAELDKLMQDIEVKRKELQQKLDELKAAHADQWQSVSAQLQQSFNDVKKSIQDALAKTK
jgi:hypothetical protein